jgi:hypothetical protein
MHSIAVARHARMHTGQVGSILTFTTNPSSAPIEFNQPLSIHNLLDTWYTEHLVKWKDLELLILGRNDFSQGFNETLVI